MSTLNRCIVIADSIDPNGQITRFYRVSKGITRLFLSTITDLMTTMCLTLEMAKAPTGEDQFSAADLGDLKQFQAAQKAGVGVHYARAHDGMAFLQAAVKQRSRMIGYELPLALDSYQIYHPFVRIS